MPFARILGAVLCALTFAALATGCGSTVRAVTHVATWQGSAGEYMYIAYAENNDVSKVQLCTINNDNSITCKDQAAVNKLLNAD